MTTVLDHLDPRELVDLSEDGSHPLGVYGHHGYLPWELIHFNLPYRDPKTTLWVRENQEFTFTVTAGSVRHPDGSRTTPIPYGKYARAGLLWMCTEAKITNNPRLTLGSSYREFMGKLGIPWNSGSAGAALEQLRALFAASLGISVDETVRNGQGARIQDFGYRMTSSSDLWFSSREIDEQEALLPSTVTLSGDLFGSILEHGNPVNLAAWRHIQATSKSPLALDVYTWLACRMFRLESFVHINWAQLHGQFGSDSDMRVFKQNFRKALATALEVYPEANVSEVGGGTRTVKGFKGLLLKPSAPALDSKVGR